MSQLRPATPDDLDAIVALEARAGAVHWSPAQFAEELTRANSRVLLAESDGALLGCAFGWIVADECHVMEIAVSPDARRQGLGRSLLEALIAACGGGPTLLEVRADNLAARTLYERCGFLVVGRRPRYYPDGEDAVLMTRESTF